MICYCGTRNGVKLQPLKGCQITCHCCKRQILSDVRNDYVVGLFIRVGEGCRFEHTSERIVQV